MSEPNFNGWPWSPCTGLGSCVPVPRLRPLVCKSRLAFHFRATAAGCHAKELNARRTYAATSKQHTVVDTLCGGWGRLLCCSHATQVIE